MYTVKEIEDILEKGISLSYCRGMDLFTSLKHGSESSPFRSNLHHKKEIHKTRMSEVAHLNAKKICTRLHHVKRRVVLLFWRIFMRKKWLSIQCFSLASLVNQYLAVLNAQNEQMRQKKMLKFTSSAPKLLKKYKTSVYKKYRKALGNKNQKEPSLGIAMDVVYSELKIINDLYQRRLQWKRIVDSTNMLIKASMHRY